MQGRLLQKNAVSNQPGSMFQTGLETKIIGDTILLAQNSNSVSQQEAEQVRTSLQYLTELLTFIQARPFQLVTFAFLDNSLASRFDPYLSEILRLKIVDDDPNKTTREPDQSIISGFLTVNEENEKPVTNVKLPDQLESKFKAIMNSIEEIEMGDDEMTNLRMK